MKTILLILAIMGLALLVIYLPNLKKAEGRHDAFAQCLASKDVTMYGANWCSHCQNEKAAFGDSFKYVPYVECPDQPKLCTEMRIESFPTWILSDGKPLVGEQGLERLSQESGCGLDVK